MHCALYLCTACVLLSYEVKTYSLSLFTTKEYSEAELKKWKLKRVSEQFRVIALGLPVPPYRGNPLDPPLRSRFQARVISGIPFQVSDGWRGLLISIPVLCKLHPSHVLCVCLAALHAGTPQQFARSGLSYSTQTVRVGGHVWV